jgi:hypothetical protein
MTISEMKVKNLAKAKKKNLASILCKLLLLSSSLPKESHQALFKLCCRIEPISAFSVRCAASLLNRIAFKRKGIRTEAFRDKMLFGPDDRSGPCKHISLMYPTRIFNAEPSARVGVKGQHVSIPLMPF